MPADYCVVKLNFSYAFIIVYIVTSCWTQCCSKFLGYTSYVTHPLASTLSWSISATHSREGPQQGDPLGPLLFCGTIHPLLLSLTSELNLAYMDDVTLGGPESHAGGS